MDGEAEEPAPGGAEGAEGGSSRRDQAAASSSGSTPHACYLIVHSVAKKHNIGTLARSATAFGVAEVLLVGERSYNSFGSHGSADHCCFKHFPSLAEVRAYLLARGARVLGVEIEDGAVAVDAPGGGVFTGPTAFILGNEGSGLSKAQMAICDGFVYIPQYGPGTASLNVATAAGIVLHRFASWAGYAERPRTGNKFDVADRGVRTAPRGYVPEDDPDTLRRKRAEARAELERMAEQAAGGAGGAGGGGGGDDDGAAGGEGGRCNGVETGDDSQ